MEPTARRRGRGNHPNLALRLERTVRVADTIVTIPQPHLAIPAAELVDAASRAVADDLCADMRDAVVAAMLSRAAAYVDVALARKTGEHPLPAGMASEDLRSADGLLLAQERGGAAHAASYLEQAELGSIASHLRSADAVAHGRSVWDATGAAATGADQPGALDACAAAYTGRGIDAERFISAAIIHESRKHIGLIWHEANKLTRNRPDVADDMLGYGWQGLRAALRSYEPTQAALATYACPRINGAIRSGLRSELPYSKRSSDLINAAARAEEALIHELSRTPSLPELAARLGESLEVLKKLPALQPTASIEEMTAYADERDHTAVWLADPADVEHTALATIADAEIAAALAALPADEAAAVQLVVLDGYRPAEAAEVLGIDTRRLRTLKNRGLTVLSERLAHLVT